ncbi:hypothetical protein ACOSQ3_032451 [Xanthoceras sorbifolium]
MYIILSPFPKGYLYNFTNLEELWLDDSSLHISLLHSIAAVTSLQTWSMGSCQVHGFIYYMFLVDFQCLMFANLPNFKNLKNMYMDENNISITFLQMIRLMTSLEYLSLSSHGL